MYHWITSEVYSAYKRHYIIPSNWSTGKDSLTVKVKLSPKFLCWNQNIIYEGILPPLVVEWSQLIDIASIVPITF